MSLSYMREIGKTTIENPDYLNYDNKNFILKNSIDCAITKAETEFKANNLLYDAEEVFAEARTKYIEKL